MKKRSVFVGGIYPNARGGSEYQAHLLARSLAEYHDVFYIWRANKTPSVASPSIEPLRSYEVRRKRCLSLFLGRACICDYRQILGAMRRIRPDYIYQRGASAYTGICASYARRYGCKLIWHIASQQDVVPVWFSAIRTAAGDYIDKKCAEYGIRHADCIIGQANYQDNLLYKHYGRHCHAIIGNVHPLPQEPLDKGNCVSVVWVANIKPNKQPEYFVDLARRLSGIERVRFVMVGRPADGPYQRQLASRMQGLKKLEYVGEQPIDEVNRIIAKSHILVNTSKYEGFPNTFVQAWLRRVPVVSMNIDPDGVLGIHKLGFHSGTFDDLVRDTKRLVEDADLRRRMGMAAEVYAIANHSIDANIRKVLAFFQA